MARETETYVLDRGGTVLAGRYRVLELLGVGAMGSVWVAEQLALKRKVVVKFHEEAFVGTHAEVALQRFLRETRALAQVRHRNVIELYEVGQTEEREPYLILELLEGETLARRMGREERLPFQEALLIAVAIAEGLEAVHAAGILHRDVKPENIFLHETEGQMVPKLLDFGLARSADPRGRITWSGSAIGTPGYMAPEQARGEGNLDRRVDIYALGVVLYEMVAGELPFDSQTVAGLLRAVIEDPPTPLSVWRPDLKGPFADAVMRAIAPARRDRFDDVRLFRAALVGLLEASGIQVRGPRSGVGLQRSTRTRRRADTPVGRD